MNPKKRYSFCSLSREVTAAGTYKAGHTNGNYNSFVKTMIICEQWIFGKLKKKREKRENRLKKKTKKTGVLVYDDTHIVVMTKENLSRETQRRFT